MNARVINTNGILSVRIESNRIIVYDLTSAIDFLESIFTETGLQRVAVDRDAFANDFFLFGMSQIDYIMQLLGQYGTKLAIIGDFSDIDADVTSALNRPENTSLFLVDSEQVAVEKLSAFA